MDEMIEEFLNILEEWEIDFDELGLSYEDLEDMDEDDLNNILAQLEPDDDDEDDDGEEEEEED